MPPQDIPATGVGEGGVAVPEAAVFPGVTVIFLPQPKLIDGALMVALAYGLEASA